MSQLPSTSIRREGSYVELFLAGNDTPFDTLKVEYPPIEPGSSDPAVLRTRRDCIVLQLRFAANFNRFRFFEKIIIETKSDDGSVTRETQNILVSGWYYPGGEWITKFQLLRDKFGTEFPATGEDTIIDARIYSY